MQKRLMTFRKFPYLMLVVDCYFSPKATIIYQCILYYITDKKSIQLRRFYVFVERKQFWCQI